MILRCMCCTSIHPWTPLRPRTDRFFQLKWMVHSLQTLEAQKGIAHLKAHFDVNLSFVKKPVLAQGCDNHGLYIRNLSSDWDYQLKVPHILCPGMNHDFVEANTTLIWRMIPCQWSTMEWTGADLAVDIFRFLLSFRSTLICTRFGRVIHLQVNRPVPQEFGQVVWWIGVICRSGPPSQDVKNGETWNSRFQISWCCNKCSAPHI